MQWQVLHFKKVSGPTSMSSQILGKVGEGGAGSYYIFSICCCLTPGITSQSRVSVQLFSGGLIAGALSMSVTIAEKPGPEMTRGEC